MVVFVQEFVEEEWYNSDNVYNITHRHLKKISPYIYSMDLNNF